MITRRSALIVASGIGLIPITAQSRQPDGRLPRVGLITTNARDHAPVIAFREEMARLGHIAGKTIQIEERYAEGQFDRFPAFASELIELKVDVFALIGAVTVAAVRKMNSTIPVAFCVVADPVAVGMVPNAQKPGGSMTGATNYDPTQPKAQMQLLKTILPGITSVAILGDAGVGDALDRANIQAAQAEGLRPVSIRLRGAREDLDAVFASIKSAGAGAVLGLQQPAVSLLSKRIVALATASRLPTMLTADLDSSAPMIAYGTSFADAGRLMASQVDRILKGTRPGDLPIEVVTKHHIVINRPLTRELGVTIPADVIARADKIVE